MFKRGYFTHRFTFFTSPTHRLRGLSQNKSIHISWMLLFSPLQTDEEPRRRQAVRVLRLPFYRPHRSSRKTGVLNPVGEIYKIIPKSFSRMKLKSERHQNLSLFSFTVSMPTEPPEFRRLDFSGIPPPTHRYPIHLPSPAEEPNLHRKSSA